MAVGKGLVAVFVGAVAALSACGGSGGSDASSQSTEPDVSTAPAAPSPSSQRAISMTFAPHRGQWFFAALPTGWRVLDETANGIDIASPDATGGVSFEYLHGSAAAAVAGGAAVDNAGFASWLFQSQGASNVRIARTESIGRFTDAVGASWTFDGREFDAVANGDNVHGVMEVGTAIDRYGDWVGMSWQRVAQTAAWSGLAANLAAVSRSITILQVQSTGGSLRMPATDASSGQVSATQDDVQSRLSQDRENATLGFETLVDPTTGTHYDAPFEAYDSSRGGYFLEKPGGSQQLEPGG
jgi:hypothetical protein